MARRRWVGIGVLAASCWLALAAPVRAGEPGEVSWLTRPARLSVQHSGPMGQHQLWALDDGRVVTLEWISGSMELGPADQGPTASLCRVPAAQVAKAVAALRRGSLCKTPSNSGNSVGGAIAIAADLGDGQHCVVRRRSRTWSAADSKLLSQVENLVHSGTCVALPDEVSAAALGAMPKLDPQVEWLQGGTLTESFGFDPTGELLAWQFLQPLPQRSVQAALAQQAAELANRLRSVPCQPNVQDGREGEVQVRVRMGKVGLGPWNAATWQRSPCLQPVWRWLHALRAPAQGDK